MTAALFRRPPRLEPTTVPHCFGGSSEEVDRGLRSLSIANRYFGGLRSALRAVRELLARDRPRPIRLLDVGCGLAEIPRALARWARRKGLDLRIAGIDEASDVVGRAALASRRFPEIHIVRADARELPFPPGRFHYVFSAMLLHYFSWEEAATLLRTWGALASRGVVVSDVERHWFPSLAMAVLARVSASPLFGEGPRRTVLRGFTPEEMARLAEAAGFVAWHVHRSFPFRLTLVAWHE